MAIVFNKQLQANRLNLTFNNNVVEFYSDSGIAPTKAQLIVSGNLVTIYPNPNGIFRYNYKELMSTILNVDNYADNLDVNLALSYVYNWDKIYLESIITTKIFLSNDTIETNNWTTDWLSGYVNLKEWKTTYPPNSLLTNVIGMIQKPNGNAYYNQFVKYWYGYPFDMTLFNNGLDITLTNNNNLLNSTFVATGNKVTRLVFSDGQTDNTIEDLLPFSDGINDIVIDNGLNEFNVNVYKDTRHCPNGVYIKWVNSLGGWNYWLFNKGQATKKTSSRGALFNDTENVENTISPYVSLGKDSNEVIKTRVQRVSENYKTTLEDLLDSSKVYLFTGVPFAKNNTNDWLEVELKSGSFKIDNSRSDLYAFDFEFGLPKNVTRSL
jgi:hypothetical protein